MFLQYHSYKRFNKSCKMPFSSLYFTDGLSDLGELLRELFDPLEVEQNGEDSGLLEEEEFGENIRYDGGLLAVLGFGELLAVDGDGGSCQECGPYAHELDDLEVVGGRHSCWRR